MIKYFLGSYIFTAICFVLAFLWAMHSNASILSVFFVIFVLSVLEVSLSFDNAVVNAGKLEKMSPLWQKRFLTWGILIAVFGMRFLFPLLIVAIFAHLNFLDVLNMALNDTEKYSHYLHTSHPYVITFGASFLIMLFLNYFFNTEKKIHWIKFIEEKLTYCGKIKGLSTIIASICIFSVQHFCTEIDKMQLIISGVSGIIIYLLIDGLSKALEKRADNSKTSVDCPPNFNFANSCFINFLYLELIDASFSLDGALGAFALSKDIIIITLGLSIGAMFVRSLTIMLVEKKTLQHYIYLEHGAHWAIGALAVIMYISAVQEVSEIITGFIGLIFIGLAFISSIKENNKNKIKEIKND